MQAGGKQSPTFISFPLLEDLKERTRKNTGSGEEMRHKRKRERKKNIEGVRKGDKTIKRRKSYLYIRQSESE